MKSQSWRLSQIAAAAMIAAAYAVLTLLAAIPGLAYLPVQFRFSEALTILPAYLPAAVPGLTVGCLVANLFSSYGPADMIFGTAATFLAALLSRFLRRFRIKGIPFLSFLPPVIVNAVIVGAEITFLSPKGFTSAEFLATALSVGGSELLVLAVLGLPLSILFEKNRFFIRLQKTLGYEARP